MKQKQKKKTLLARADVPVKKALFKGCGLLFLHNELRSDWTTQLSIRPEASKVKN
jgi:hypothetical protein